MVQSFFRAAAQSPGRQFAFRTLVAFHLLLLLGAFHFALNGPPESFPLLGQFLLVGGIVEGALLVGWRLTQLPKSRSLEFLLASPLRPHLILLTEASVGLVRLAFVSLAAIPVLLIFVWEGHLHYRDVLVLVIMPLTWGSITGLGLTAWAYEPLTLRRWGERLLMALILVYLVVGILAGENLRQWLTVMPYHSGTWIINSFHAFHKYNPFAVMQYALENPPQVAAGRVWAVEALAACAIGVLMLRAACRLKGHFHERHYSPIPQVQDRKRKPVGDRPLSWWAVKRVSEYAGKVNLWLAGGFGVLYAVHTLAGPHWPPWMGRQAFVLFDRLFGVSGVAAALVVLAAVPAAYQYGLWDSNTQDRCRRLELLLLSKLDAHDFWKAALAAAWNRGRGYFAVAVLLWLAAAIAGAITPAQFLLSLAAGMLMWLLYFALGFRAFSTGMQANNLGLLLTVGLPLTAVALYRMGHPALSGLTPPGCVYLASTAADPKQWFPGVVLIAAATVLVHRQSLLRCLEELHRWYERFHGQKVVN